METRRNLAIVGVFLQKGNCSWSSQELRANLHDCVREFKWIFRSEKDSGGDSIACGKRCDSKEVAVVTGEAKNPLEVFLIFFCAGLWGGIDGSNGVASIRG
jgi:hypothetical protein